MYIQVNIGRNFVADKNNATGGTLSDLEWRCFRADVCMILDQFREHSDMGHEYPEELLGTGVWDGVREESAKISLYHEGGFDLDSIREQLFRLKKEYGQDSIALIIGSELI